MDYCSYNFPLNSINNAMHLHNNYLMYLVSDKYAQNSNK